MTGFLRRLLPSLGRVDTEALGDRFLHRATGSSGPLRPIQDRAGILRSFAWVLCKQARDKAA